MQWIKKNLFFALGGLVALILMVLAIFYVLQSTKASAEVQEEINAQVAELQRLHEKEPFPSDENIALAKQEQQKVNEMLAESKAFFAPVSGFKPTDNHGFQELLGTTIFDLQKQASQIGVTLPAQYAFSFAGQKNALQLSPTSIEPWLGQLAEIRAICGILFQAKINELYGIQRVAITDDDRRLGGASADYLPNATVQTNQLAIFAPYQVSFRGFSTEIASVLTGFLESTNCFIVKSVTVDPAPYTPASAAAAGLNPVYTPVPNRYAPAAGLPPEGPVPGPARPQYPVPAPIQGTRAAAVPASVTVLAEKPLRITLVVEAVKLRDRK